MFIGAILLMCLSVKSLKINLRISEKFMKIDKKYHTAIYYIGIINT